MMVHFFRNIEILAASVDAAGKSSLPSVVTHDADTVEGPWNKVLWRSWRGEVAAGVVA